MDYSVYVVLSVVSPYLIQYACKRWVVLDAIGAVVLCYAAGFLLKYVFQISPEFIQKGSEIALLLGIPCLLFSVNLNSWLQQSRHFLFGYALAAVSACISAAFVCLYVFPEYAHSAEMAGMLTGNYTGGTPNLIAIGKALQVPEILLVNMNTVDVIIGACYFLLLLGPLPRLLRIIFRLRGKAALNQNLAVSQHEPTRGDAPWLMRVLGVLLAGVCLGISLGVSFWVHGKPDPIWVILGLSTVAIILSTISFVHQLPGTHASGEYLILIFCVGMGGMINLEQLSNLGGEVFQFTLCLLLGAVLLHYASCWLIGLDVDVAIVTNVAAVYSPAFVPPVIQAIKKPEMLLSGVTMGLIGFAIGNYLGISLALWFRILLNE